MEACSRKRVQLCLGIEGSRGLSDKGRETRRDLYTMLCDRKCDRVMCGDLDWCQHWMSLHAMFNNFVAE
jgi:hypothetical protein